MARTERFVRQTAPCRNKHSPRYTEAPDLRQTARAAQRPTSKYVACGYRPLAYRSIMYVVGLLTGSYVTFFLSRTS